MPREAPFRVHVGELVRRPGIARPYRLEVPVDWAVEMSRIEPDPPLVADLDLVAASGGVIVRGTVSVTATHTCTRCLGETTATSTIEIAQLFEHDGDDEAEYRLDDDDLYLEPLLRDEVLLAMPLLPSCGDECPGLVRTPETDLNDRAPGEAGRPESPFAALQDLFEPGD